MLEFTNSITGRGPGVIIDLGTGAITSGKCLRNMAGTVIPPAGVSPCCPLAGIIIPRTPVDLPGVTT
ncbi:hypothetical protein [Sodalis sp. dw_96]|uniref:hypothetical protein n=1 Tax=Sodalis sp. dw_96 TaxID=2719794 RepID=UPI001BD3E1B6|nr:hypothetical protein [Sodalis sp. dw_96]